MERLDKYISSQLPNISRKEAREIIRRGAVMVNGITAKSPEDKIEPGSDVVLLSGREIKYKKHIYIMLNKPAGIVTATRDSLSKTVLELIPPDLRRSGLFPAGRLDRDTVGFVLITDDGDLAHRILSPKSHVEKRYFVRLQDDISPETASVFAGGMELSDKRLLPAELEVLGLRECIITLKEGKYHQIKRMFEAVGNKVVYLKRIMIAGISLDENLEEGECRELSQDEEIMIKSC